MERKNKEQKGDFLNNLKKGPYNETYIKNLNIMREIALKLLKSEDKWEQKYFILMNIALYYIRSYNYPRAIIVMTEQLSVIEKSKGVLYKKYEIITRMYLAYSLRCSGQAEEAIKTLELAEKLISSEDGWLRFMVQYNLGNAYKAANSMKEAYTIWKKCFNSSTKFVSWELRWKIIRSLAVITWVLGQYKETIGYLELLKCELITSQFLMKPKHLPSELALIPIRGNIPEVDKLDIFNPSETIRK